MKELKYEFKDKDGKILILKLSNNKITFNCKKKDIANNKFNQNVIKID